MAISGEWRERVETARLALRRADVERAVYWMKKLPASLADEPEVMGLHGLLLCRQGQLDRGLALLRAAVAKAPSSRELLEDLSDTLISAARPVEAAQVLDRLAELDGAGLSALRKKVVVTMVAGSPAEQNASMLRLAEATPDRAESLLLRAGVALRRRRFAEAISMGEEALAISPGHPMGSTLLWAMLSAGTDPLYLRKTTEAWCRARFQHIDVPPQRRRRRPTWGTRGRTAVGGEGKAGGAGGKVGGRLRIGYLSGDFHAHVVARFFLPLIRNHDRTRVQVLAYYTGQMNDTVTSLVAGQCDVFRNVAALPDAEAAAVIDGDELDVLVDLGGHTESGRPGILAHRPALVQVTYLGYPATTGMPEVDYRISDAVADPPGETDGFCTERLWRLPRCAWAFELASGEVFDPTVRSPSERGEPIAFGSFNVLTKVCPQTTDLWAQVLAACGGSRLRMTDRVGIASDEEARGQLIGELTAAGAAAGQVELGAWLGNPAAHRARLREVDLLLDPLSYNGTTTTCEGLYFGVPTLTLPGRSHVSRVGASLLTAAGLETFIARDAADFVARARRFAEDPSLLAGLRPKVREKYLASPIYDHRGLARAMEDALEAMVREKQAEPAVP